MQGSNLDKNQQLRPHSQSSSKTQTSKGPMQSLSMQHQWLAFLQNVNAVCIIAFAAQVVPRSYDDRPQPRRQLGEQAVAQLIKHLHHHCGSARAPYHTT